VYILKKREERKGVIIKKRYKPNSRIPEKAVKREGNTILYQCKVCHGWVQLIYYEEQLRTCYNCLSPYLRNANAMIRRLKRGMMQDD